MGRMSIGDFFEILRAVRFGIFTFWWSDFNLAAVTGAARGLEVLLRSCTRTTTRLATENHQ